MAEEEEREEAERKRRQEEAARRRQEEEEKKKKGKRKGLGGLSPEKKKLLKKLIMQKAAEDLKNEAKRKAEERENTINSRVEPLALDGLNEAQMQDLVKKLHGKMAELEEEVYDWEFKLRRQEFEINDLTLKVNDTRGKFVKPVLRKISKTEAKLAKLERTKKDDFRTTLKSGHKHDKIEEEESAEAPAEAPVEAEAEA